MINVGYVRRVLIDLNIFNNISLSIETIINSILYFYKMNKYQYISISYTGTYAIRKCEDIKLRISVFRTDSQNCIKYINYIKLRDM